MDRGGSAGLHFACDTIGNDLIIPGCETEGGINGLPKFSSETANVGGCLGVTANWVGRNGSAVTSESKCQSESATDEVSASTVVSIWTEFPMFAATSARSGLPSRPATWIAPGVHYSEKVDKTQPEMSWKAQNVDLEKRE